MTGSQNHRAFSYHSGKMACLLPLCRGTCWCIHRTDAVKEHEDAEYFWHGIANDQDVSEGRAYCPVFVPIIPSENQFAECRICTSKKLSGPEGTAVYELWLSLPAPLNVLDKQFRVGITGPGEGRFIWRGMIWDYFQQKAEPNLKCKSKSHSFHAQTVLSEDLRLRTNESRGRAQVWSMWYNKVCLTCYECMNENHDDLIPDVRVAKWSNTFDEFNESL